MDNDYDPLLKSEARSDLAFAIGRCIGFAYLMATNASMAVTGQNLLHPIRTVRWRQQAVSTRVFSAMIVVGMVPGMADMVRRTAAKHRHYRSAIR